MAPREAGRRVVTEQFSVDTGQPEQAVDVTLRVKDLVKRAGIQRGTCHVMTLHSTAAVVVNEVADPNIGRDVIAAVREHALKCIRQARERSNDFAGVAMCPDDS